MEKTENEKKEWLWVIITIGLTIMAIIGGLILADRNKVLNRTKDDERQSLISIGFSQLGAESEWRTGNSISMKKTFTTKKGYDLIFKDAQQQQEQQIKSIREFIQQDVDYIVLAPIVETDGRLY